ncbi:lysine 2,3-aminomutase [Rhodobacter sp. TJ_12]|uniref:lysine-2,3-aminomutase-like protein n=1 Tax=Rhodobacter sp. TJ_12 TaxID=2029399 RepID=UPI001CC074F8|nr:lysine-2,3-aminomutase-like protein [Rhodobacter sp. TJ_12]MBZ4021176.1 lysine 2,3-aminomutase [Rhodobacter sp. TJ_12]
MTALPPKPALTQPDALLRAGLVQKADLPALTRVAESFRIRITPAMRAAIAAPGDAVAAQFVPTAAELTTRPEELLDPIGDNAHAPVPGLTHRYPDRAILHITKTCDVYCRFCFRRETVGETGPLPEGDLAQALAYIAATPKLREIILTGGDPLTLAPRRLEVVLARLSEIAHITTVRLHTRVPVVAPERITEPLAQMLRAQRPAVWIVVHTNHAQELTPPARAALARLVDAGIPLLSQSVLLRGVNDTRDALLDLFRALQDLRVKPYYLHHCDLAPGTSHFRTTLAHGRALMASLRGPLSGAALPAYVLDIPGGFGKVPITADYVAPGDAPGLWRVTDWQGRVHDYADPPS